MIEHVDRVCDRFEAAWQAGGRPSIEAYLEDPRADREAFLFEHLLLLELDYRHRCGESPAAAEYLARFPQYAAVIAPVYADAAAGKALADTPTRDTATLQRLPEAEFGQPCTICPGTKLGKYEVLEEIGHGGMGHVFKAMQPPLGRAVAIKVLWPPGRMSPEALLRFQREVRLVSQLGHPNVVVTHDAGEHQGIPYLVMEYLEGSDLAALVRQRGPLAVTQAVDYILQAARGLQCAHQRGIVHRDVKPSNLWLDPTGRIKVLDLGLARVLPSAQLALEAAQWPATSSQHMLGTWDYVSPEQAKDPRAAGCPSDIYSLGCTLHYLLTGRPPYGGSTGLDKFLAHCNEPIPSLASRRLDVSAELDRVFTKMLAKAPDERFASLAELIDALETLPAGRETRDERVPAGVAHATPQPDMDKCVSSVAVSRGTPPAKLRRLRAIAVSAVVLGLLVVLGCFFGWRAFQRARSSPMAGASNAALRNHRTPSPEPRTLHPEHRTPAEPRESAPAEPRYADETLFKFLDGAIKEFRSKYIVRSLYTEVLHTARRQQTGTWFVGGGLTRDRRSYRIDAGHGLWTARALSDKDVAELNLSEGGISRNLSEPLFKLPAKPLVTLNAHDLRVETGPDGQKRLTGRLRCASHSQETIEDPGLILQSVSVAGEVMHGNDRQQYLGYGGPIRLPLDEIAVEIPLDDAIAKQGARLFLQGFLWAPEPSFYQISNDVIWTGSAGAPASGS